MSIYPPEPLELEGCTVDLPRRLVVRRDGSTASLTHRETDLLAWLARKSGETVSREELLVEVWDYSADMVTRTVDNTVRRLRTKVELDARNPRHVLTVFGEGYTFAALRTAPRALPSGRVALAALRVSGLDGLRGRDPDVARAALEVFGQQVRSLADSLGGVVVGADDAPVVAFGEPTGAVAFAGRLQQDLLEADWPAALLADPAGGAPGDRPGAWRGLRVGVGVALGEGHPVADAYEGGVYDVALALRDAAHGGQVLLGPEVWAGVHLGELDMEATPLGAHPLVAGGDPVPMASALPRRLAERTFAPPRTPELRQTNLPAEVTSFVGRRKDLLALRGSFARGQRLITLLGTAGAGKTRLARRFGADRAAAYSTDGGGVWFADLSATNTAEGVVAAVAQALGVPLDPQGDVDADIGQVGRALAARGRTLVILDNGEQVVDGLIACIAPWREAAPRVRFLVTSRTVLGLDGEAVHRLLPLEPAEALALFVDRARAVRMDFAMGPDDLRAVKEIASRLDHNPLALELAAVRVKVLPPRHLAERLDARFRALGRGPRDGVARHTTLEEAIDWSWGLLEPWAARCFAQLGAFRGGLEPSAARAVLDIPDDPGLDGVLALLRDRSMLRLVEPPGLPGHVRIEILESLRAFASDRLAERADADAVADRHVAWARVLGLDLLRDLDREGGATAARRLALEEANLRAAHARALQVDPAAACDLARALDALLAPRGPYEGHLALLDRTLEAAAEADPAARVPVRLSRARARQTRGEVLAAERDLHQAARECREASDPVLMAEVLLALSRFAASRGRAAEARRFLDGADDRTTVDTTPRLQARILAVRARHAADAGRLGQARDLGREAVAQLEAAGLLRDVGDLLPDLASWCVDLGDMGEARTLLRRALQLGRARGDLRLEARILTALGALLHEQGELAASADHLEPAVELQRRLGESRGMGIGLGHLGAVTAELGDHVDALGHLDQALVALDEADDTRHEGWFLAIRASVHHTAGRHESAAADVRRSITRLQEAGDRRLLGRVCVRAALVLRALGRSDEAGRALVEAERVLGSVDDADGLVALSLARRLAAGEVVHEPARARAEARWVVRASASA